MESEKYNIGDYVIIIKDDSKIVGKIEEIFIEDNIKMIRYNEFYFPDKTLSGKQEHNSKYELYKTDEIVQDLISNIKDKCEVLKFDLYIKRILSQKEKKSFSLLSENNIFFVRQKYSVGDDYFAPELTTTCYCDQIFNPDKNFIRCKKCKEPFHLECFLLGETKKCFNSGCNNNIEEQMQSELSQKSNTTTNISNSNNMDMVMMGNKRQRDQEEIEKENEKQKSINFISVNKSLSTVNNSLIVDFRSDQRGKDLTIKETNNFNPNSTGTHSGIINISNSNNTNLPIIKTSNPNQNPNNNNNPDEEKNSDSLYPNLSEERRKYLSSLIDKTEKKNNSISRNITTDEKSRRIMREKIFNALLYGVEEIKENEDWRRMKVPELSQADISENVGTKFCNNLSVSIETAVFLQNNEEVSSNYKKRLSTIYSNLSDSRNRELRYAILNNDILPEELVKMQAEELAPSSLKNRRTERQNKYFKEQVLMTEETKIIAKTHKGEAILTVDNGNSNSNNEEAFMSEGMGSYYSHSRNQNNATQAENNINSDNNVYSSDGEEKNINSVAESANLIPNTGSNSINSPKNASQNLNGNNATSTIMSNYQNENFKSNSQMTYSNKRKEIKYKNLTQEQNNFWNILEECKRENLINKFNDKLKNHLKISTYEEIIQLRENKEDKI